MAETSRNDWLFPNFSKDMIHGNFKVQIRSIIDSMGNLIGADILKSSGNSSMDALAMKILQQAAPFEPFPVDMASIISSLRLLRLEFYKFLAMQILAFDFGTQYIGVAVGQTLTNTSSPLVFEG